MNRILVIDDNRDNLLSCKALISDLFNGFGVHTASSGPDGIALAKAHHPDVILLDIRMPGMDGYDVCNILKKDETLCDIPVIFVTALKEDSANKVRALNAGADGFLTNPMDETELIAQIKAMLKIKEANDFKKSEKHRLEKLVAERTSELQEELLLNRQMNNRLCESEEKFRVLYEKAPLGFQSLDFDARIIEVNDVWLETLGYHRDEVIGKWFGDFLAPEYIPAFGERFSAFKAAGRIYVEFEMLHKDGSRRWMAFDGRIGYELNGEFKQTHCILLDITERKRAEEVLRVSEEKYRLLIENLNEGLWYIAQDGRTTFVNPRMAEMLGYTVEEMLGKHLFEFMDERGAEIARHNLERRRQGIKEQHEFEFIHKDGSRIYTLLETAPIIDNKGHYAGAVAGVSDITARKRAEESLHIALSKYKTLFDSFPLGIAVTDEAGNILEANRMSERLLGLSQKEHTQRNLDSPEWRIVRTDDTPMPPEEYASAKALKEKRLVENVETGIVKPDGAVTWLSVTAAPLSVKGYGVFIAYSDITERKQAEARLLSENAWSESVINAAPNIIVGLGEGSQIKIFNKFAETLTGFNAEEVLGKPWIDLFILREQRAELYHVWKQIVENGLIEYHYENSITTKTGEQRLIRWNNSVLTENGRFRMVLSIGEDITERKQAEEKLKESEERFTLAMKASNDGLFDWNLETNEIYYSPGWKKMLGYEDDELANDFSVWETTTDQVDVKKSWELQKKLVSKQIDRFVMEFRMKHKEGHWVDILSRAEAIFDEKGKATRIVGTHIDITARKRAEEELLKTKLLLEQTARMAKVGGWEKNFITGTDTWSEVTRKIHEVEADFVPTMQNAIAFYREGESRNKIIDVVTRCMETGESFDVELQIITAKGNERWVHAIGDCHVQDGKCVGLYGTFQDITERKRAEQDLQASQAELQAVYEHAPVMMCLLGPGRKVLYANLAFTAFTGVSEAELVQGRACGVFGCINAAEHPDGCGFGASCRDCRLRLAIEDTLATGQGHRGVEYRATLERAGVCRNVILLGATTRIENNESPRVLLCLEDITERISAEEAIKESDRQFRLLVETLPISLSIVTLDGDVLYINPKCKELFEIDPALGKQDALLLWVNPDDRQIWLQEIKTKRAVQNFEMHLKTKTGKEIWALGSGIFFQYQNQTCVLSTHHDISEVKQIQEKLRESEAKYRTLVEGSLQGVVIAKDKPVRLCFANAAMKSICGYGADELLQMSPQDLAALVHPDDRERFFGNFRRRLSGEPVSSLAEYQLLHKDGGITWTMCQSNTIVYLGESATLTMFVDISEKKKADEQFRLLNRAVEASPVSVSVTDRDGNIIYTNPFFTSITGFSFEEVLGKNPRILKSGFHKEEVYRDLWSTIRSGKDWTGELCNRKRSGELYWVKAIISPIVDHEGVITNFVAIKEDITERKKILEDLVAAKEQAEESDRLKSAFLANMSHEIRTPMNGILGFLELLGNPDLTEGEKEKYIGIMNKSGQRLLSTINDIVEISRIEAGDIQINRQEIRLQKFLSYYYDFFLPQANEKGLHLELVPCQDALKFIFTDKSKLDSILTNLIKNAIKFTEKGSITFGCEPKGPTDLLLFVKDTGKGIHPDKLALVFERFMQADLSLSRGYEGSGLGLAISKAYVEALGGRIWIESELGKGSCFYVAVPGVRSDAKEANPLPAGDLVNRMSPLPKKLRILVAEDDEASYMYLETILKPYHADITRCTTGRKAVEFCRSHPDTNLILMDNKMPDMDGYEATRRIREFNNTAVIIAQTAYALVGDREKAIEAGCTDFIAKPILKDKLFSLITKHLG